MRRLLLSLMLLLVVYPSACTNEGLAKAKKGGGEWKTLTARVTAYCPCVKCCSKKYGDGKTAIGRDAYTKGVAVNKKVIPLRSMVDIPGYGIVEADDVGGAMKKKCPKRYQTRLDVRFKTHKKALKWGVKYLTITWKKPTRK